jgi:hypothetical protein
MYCRCSASEIVKNGIWTSRKSKLSMEGQAMIQGLRLEEEECDIYVSFGKTDI